MMARVVDAHTELMSPVGVNARHLENVGIAFTVAFALIGLCHALVARHFKRPYFVLHVFANIVISALTLPGAMRALTNPQLSTTISAEGQSNALYQCWIFAIHIYHPIFFKTGAMDWIHHVPVYMLNTMIFSVPSVDAIHLQSLILTGIPGGIDYLLQVIEGEGKMSRAYYKDCCAMINNWIRNPLGIISSYACFVGMHHGASIESTWNRVVLAALALHAFWNPPFFMRQAIEANVVDTINRHGLEAGTIKLPKVRALSGKEPKSAKKEAYPVATDSPKAKKRSD